MAARLSALLTGPILLPRNFIFLLLVLISVRCWADPRAQPHLPLHRTTTIAVQMSAPVPEILDTLRMVSWVKLQWFVNQGHHTKICRGRYEFSWKEIPFINFTLLEDLFHEKLQNPLFLFDTLAKPSYIVMSMKNLRAIQDLQILVNWYFWTLWDKCRLLVVAVVIIIKLLCWNCLCD
jgi:hypothetical protein